MVGGMKTICVAIAPLLAVANVTTHQTVERWGRAGSGATTAEATKGAGHGAHAFENVTVRSLNRQAGAVPTFAGVRAVCADSGDPRWVLVAQAILRIAMAPRAAILVRVAARTARCRAAKIAKAKAALCASVIRVAARRVADAGERTAR